MSAPLPAAASPVGSPAGSARVRAWLAAAIAALLVLVYLSAELTYSSSHLPPARYHALDPGEVAHATNADFRLLSIRQTETWGRTTDDSSAATPGTVWVVAQLEVVPRKHTDYLLCTVALVGTDGRSWDAEGIGPVHEGESCAEDPKNVELGKTYPFVAGFSIPASETAHIAGVGVDLNSWRKYPLLRPPA